jgi:hypothetical protein
MNIPVPICRLIKNMTDVHNLVGPDNTIVDITRPGPDMPPGDERMARDVLNYLNHKGFTILNREQFEKLRQDLQANR